VSVPVARFTTLAFDERQLERWGIPEHRLPPGAVVRFRAPNLWRDRRGLVLTAIGITLLQTLLIVGLLFEHRRRRRAEIDSRRHLAAIAHMDRRAAMGELATSLAHELNQPLNAILQNAGVAQMLLAANPVPPALGEMTDIISDIRKDDIRASEVIRRMRGLLRKQELESQPVNLNDVAEETIAIVRPDAVARGIQLEMQLEDDLRLILGDRVHLQQVLLNLVMNALDAVAAMPPERRRVRVSTSQRDGEVRLAVSDTGTGIPADRLSEIFEPFFTTKVEGTGMGMGLSIARNIVEAHTGHIGAENNAGGGATAWFSVPMARFSLTSAGPATCQASGHSIESSRPGEAPVSLRVGSHM
jgi:signal transduction histidine kinase